MLYKELEIGDYVYDPFMNAYGLVKVVEDIHNILVEYDDGGGGLYCMDPTCEEFDPSLKIIKKRSAI